MTDKEREAFEAMRGALRDLAAIAHGEHITSREGLTANVEAARAALALADKVRR